MSTYFIGDVHGCYDELMILLKRLRFNHHRDTLVFVGDLINRGPKSLAVLRYIRDLGAQAKVVLGNHDLSFIAYALGAYHGRGTDFPKMLKAPDGEELVEWLRQQSLLHHDETLDVVVVHAGIPPRWSLTKAKRQAQKAEKRIRGDKAKKYFQRAYAGGTDRWRSNFDKYDKFRYRLNGFTRLRYCNAGGEPDFRDKVPLGQQHSGLQPWFEARSRYQNDGNTRLIFGHWAALGYFVDETAICIDSGCVWGGALTAIELQDGEVMTTQVASKQKKH